MIWMISLLVSCGMAAAFGQVPVRGPETTESNSLSRQEPSPDDRAKMKLELSRLQESWRWSHFDTSDGLPHSIVADVLETADTVWAITHGGPAWFDGWQWHPVEKGLTGELIFAAATDDEGYLWLGTMSGAYRGNRSGFNKVDLPKGFKSSEVGNIASNGQEVFLTANSGGGVWKMMRWVDGRIEIANLPEELAQSKKASLFETRSNRIWGSFDQGIYAYEGGKWRMIFSAGDSHLKIAKIRDNAAGDGVASFTHPQALDGLFQWFGHGEPKRVPSEGSGIVRAAGVAPNGDAAAVYRSGEVRIRHRNQWESLKPVPDGLRYALEIVFRQNGDMWVCTKQGIYLHRRSNMRWQNAGEQQVNSKRNHVNHLLRGPRGFIWAATHGGVMVLGQDGRLIDPFEDPDFYGGVEDQSPDGVGFDNRAFISSLAFDEQGHLWVCSNDSFAGLKKWDGNRWHFVGSNKNDELIGYVDRIQKDRQGRLWFLSYTRSSNFPDGCGVHRLVDGDVVSFEPIREWKDQRALDFFEDNQGRFWFATRSGVKRWDSAGNQWKNWKIGSRITGPTNRIIAHPDGGVWIARNMSRLGRIGIDDEFQRVDTSVFDATDICYASDGALWVSTHTGLHRLKNGVWSFFDPESDSASTWLMALFPAGDRVAIGSAGGGIYQLNLSEAGNPAPDIEISEPVVDQGRVYVQWRTTSWWGEMKPEEIQTRFRIGNDDRSGWENWSSWDTQNEVMFDDLSPGDYVAEVEAKGLFGAIRSRQVEFNVPTPFYQNPAYVSPVLLVSVGLLVLGLVFTVQRFRSQRALRASEAEHRTLMENASDAMMIFDASGWLNKLNTKASQLVGLSAEELLQKNVKDLFVSISAGPGEAETGLNLLDRLQRNEGDSLVAEFQIQTANSTWLPVEVSAKQMPDGRVQALLRDVTQRRQQEEERRQFDRRIVETQKLESMGLMAGGAAHDFNNLLMVIIASAEQAAAQIPADSPANDDLERVFNAVMNARGLTQQLLAYAGRGSIQTGRKNLNSEIREMVRVFEASINPNTRLTLKLAENLPEVEADESGLRQVVLNLLANASESLDGESGIVEIATGSAIYGDETLEPSEWRELPTGGDWVFLRVKDSGCGMTPEMVSRIFDPFYTTKFTGRGLGLAAVQGILRAHCGRAFVKTKPGKGSTFTILLPAKMTPPKQSEMERSRTSTEFGMILIIDDDPMVLQMTTMILDRAGYETISASSGKEGCEIFEKKSESISVLILDVTMPGMSGVEVYKYIRLRSRDLPIIFISGYSELATEEICRADRETRFLQKPFDTKSLRDAISNLRHPEREDGSLLKGPKRSGNGKSSGREIH